MLNDGIKAQTHKGTSSQFGQHYVLTGKFDRVDGILYSRLQTMREKADYQNVFYLEAEEGKHLITQVTQLQENIKQYIFFSDPACKTSFSSDRSNNKTKS